MRKYVAYYRTSVDSHEKGKSKASGLGLEAQKNIVKHFYSDQLVKEFTEVKSARTITERPVLQQAIQYCLENGCWLVVAKLDRLSRNVDDCRAIHRELKRKISFCDIPSESEVDTFTLTLYAAFSERERELIALRTKQGLEVKVKEEGEWRTGSPAFSDGTATAKAVKVIKAKASANENSIRASETICDKVKQGLSFNQIAQILNDKKFRTPGGKLFQAVQVQRIYQRFC